MLHFLLKLKCISCFLSLQINITAENAGEVVSDLGGLITETKDEDDQSSGNLGIIGSIMTTTEDLVEARNLSTTTNVRGCLTFVRVVNSN